MAMLAEKKRREKWCLNPRGKAWSEDQTKFGQRLLEKMGWSAGQGLGVNNQGPTQIVSVRKKDDNKGLGFKENGEEWLKTTSDFNELLDQLGSSVEGVGVEDGDKPLSLEDRSKKSKARVHYHKFTRGKDLSRYSEKDLASIIGPDVVKSKTCNEQDPDYTSNQVNKGSSEEYFNNKPKQNHLCEHNPHEFLLISNNNNSEDSLNNKIKTLTGSGELSHVEAVTEDVSSKILKKRKSMNYKENDDSYLEENVDIVDVNYENEKNKKKKFQNETKVKDIDKVTDLSNNFKVGSQIDSKKRKKYEESTLHSVNKCKLVKESIESNGNFVNKTSKKKKKKRKELFEFGEESSQNHEASSNIKISKKQREPTNNEDALITKSNKGKCAKDTDQVDTIDIENLSEENSHLTPNFHYNKKKKRKGENNLEQSSSLESSSHIEYTEECFVKSLKPKKNMKKLLLVEEENEGSVLLEKIEEQSQEFLKHQKKNRKKKLEDKLNFRKQMLEAVGEIGDDCKQVIDDDYICESNGCDKKKKKKKKNRQNE